MKWEYLWGAVADYSDCIFVSHIINDDHKTTFNKLGEANWELVSINNNIAYFKRPKTMSENAEIYKSNIEGYFGGKVG